MTLNELIGSAMELDSEGKFGNLDVYVETPDGKLYALATALTLEERSGWITFRVKTGS